MLPSLPGSPRLRRIVSAYSINQLGTWFGYVALSVGVFDETHSAVAVAGLFVAARFVPALLVPPLVAWVEASKRRGTLSALYVVEAITAAALGVILWHFSLAAILVLVAIDGSAALAANSLLRAEASRPERREEFTGSSGQSANSSDAIPTTDRDSGHTANAALNLAFSLTVVAGPGIAAAVVASAGRSTAMFIDAGSFLVCGALLAELRPHVAEASDASVASRLRAAWEHVRALPQLRALMIAQAAAFVCFLAAAPVEVIYAKSTLRAGDRGYGLLLAVWGAGMVIGSLVFANLKRRALGATLTGGTLAVGLAYVGLAAAPSLALACGADVIGGVGNGLQWASTLGAVQTLTPARLQGRVMGALESIGALAPAVGLSLGGALTALLSPRATFLIAGLGACGTSLLFLRVVRAGLGVGGGGDPRNAAEQTLGPEAAVVTQEK